jgi:chloride channel, nucleotide-sensitive, 1A
MSQTGKGFSVQYPSITLHAVSRTEAGPSIYCQLDESDGALGSAQPEDDVADTEMRELTLIPKNVESRKSVHTRCCESLTD